MAKIEIVRLGHAADLPLPSYQTAQAAGMDLVAAVPEERPVAIAPGDRAMIPTGLSIALPAGYEAQIRPRSGLAAKHGIGVLNSPGTIDADYRGEVMVILINHGKEPFEVSRGLRVAQMVVARYEQITVEQVEQLSSSGRGAGGFGSTGG